MNTASFNWGKLVCINIYLHYTSRKKPPNNTNFFTCPTDCALTWVASVGPTDKRAEKNGQNIK